METLAFTSTLMKMTAWLLFPLRYHQTINIMHVEQAPTVHLRVLKARAILSGRKVTAEAWVLAA